MKLIIKLLLKAKNLFIKLISLTKIICQSIIYKNKMYLFGTPIHGNIGDHAILIAEEKFLHDNFSDYKIIKVESSIIIRFNSLLKRFVGNSKILVHGGGFLGTIWPNEEKMFRITLNNYPNNYIVVFPQTAFFSNDKEGKKVLEESKEIYSKHKNLHICCREEYSIAFMKEHCPTCNISLVPDMVLYLDSIDFNNERNNVLFCIRHDKEKVNHDYEKIESFIKENYEFEFNHTDTVINKQIYFYNKNRIFKEKLNQFSKYKLVVTDRLHGMVFALISKTPCLVFENKSYKIKGVYEWINNISFIKMYNPDTYRQDIQELLSIKNVVYTNKLKSKYKKLIELIKK